MSHHELSDMAAGYALSALDSDDLKMFEAHLATCSECQADVAGMRRIVDALSMMSERAEPADQLRERILASVRAEPNRAEPAVEAIPKKLAPWWRRPVFWPLSKVTNPILERPMLFCGSVGTMPATESTR